MQQNFVDDTNEGDPRYVVLSVKYFVQIHATIFVGQKNVFVTCD